MGLLLFLLLGAILGHGVSENGPKASYIILSTGYQYQGPLRLAFLFSPTWRQDVEFKFGSCKSYSRCGFNSNLQKPLPITSSTRNGWYILRTIPNQKGLWQRYFDTSIPNAV